MPIKLIVIGKASGKEILKKEPSQSDYGKTLLTYLQEAHLPIASSCQGEGICKKCIFNENQLSCLITVGQILHSQNLATISIDYL